MGDFRTDSGRCPEYSATAALPSRGSALHAEGTCKPCCFFPKGRCQNGYDCQFCHFEHEKHKTKGHNRRRPRHNRTRNGSSCYDYDVASKVPAPPEPRSLAVASELISK